ncbi:hypothetical protein BHM03_00030939 [Ensete ventricosum]|nr:hypothetical protein BHM03_00030939 [Ensete ventricosum]
MQVGIHDPDAASSCANQDCSCSPESKSFNKGTIAAVHLDIHGHIFPSRAFVAVLPASHDASRSPTHQFLFAPLRSHREITTLGRLRCVRTSVLPCFPMRRGGLNPDLRLSLPSHEASISQFLTQSGTFKDGDLLVNKDGLRILSHSEEGGVIMKLPCKANLCSLSSFFVLGIFLITMLCVGCVQQSLIKPVGNQLSLDDVDTVKVIGKGSGGIVQLVRHKWTGQFFALKVCMPQTKGSYQSVRYYCDRTLSMHANIQVIELNIQDSVRKQIAQELRISLSTQCPCVIVCYQCFYYNGVISIVLEYMDGGSLADFLNSVRTVPEPYLAAICKQVSVDLQKKPKDRKTARLLLKHPFLSMYDDLQVDLASYFTVSGLPLSQFSKE